MSGVDVGRLRNWARAYQRLMLGGMAVEAHTAAVDDFASDEGEYPYITAADVLALLDELEAARAVVERVRALADLGVREQWPPDEWRAGIRAALDGGR